MKILYFSMSCNNKTWDDIQKKSKIKSSSAPIVFDKLVVKGIYVQPNTSIEVISFPPISTYPGSNKIAWGFKKEELFPGLYSYWLQIINLPILKQITSFLSSFSIISIWLIINLKQKNKQIIIYTPYFPIAIPIVFLSYLSGCQCTTIITDIPNFVFISNKKKTFRLFQKPYIKITEYIQSKFDKYIFLTSYMNDLINRKGKPYLVMEAICDHKLFLNNQIKQKSTRKAIMYAGGLNIKFGLSMLLDCFEEIEEDCELWIFGSGDYANDIKQVSKKNAKIKFFGKVERSIVIDYEVKATLLINLRNPEDELTKYSFPSKTVEYMSSGTPLLTTKLPGIPIEYFDYVYTIEDYNINCIKDKLISILTSDEETLYNFGLRAKEFVTTQKNYIKQGEAICRFLSTT